ncbi:hypothetical protein CHS0354_000230 [Potamilus streckersoni]|uniref:Uncharacterized protein n=1 Tax=Potamilus streckersoni TaxID=2493646 RepID=A0AAE0RQP0_9BIVA|nr:hypothetical protein CHS0354_000230 [Potamilus streckersoni]
MMFSFTNISLGHVIENNKNDDYNYYCYWIPIPNNRSQWCSFHQPQQRKLLRETKEPPPYSGKGKKPLKGTTRAKKTKQNIPIQKNNDKQVNGTNQNTKNTLNDITTENNDQTRDPDNSYQAKGNNEHQTVKRPRIKTKIQQINPNKNYKTTKGENRQQIKHELQTHPRYLTLYLTIPDKSLNKLSVTDLRYELLKHKNGNLKITKTKSADIIIWCYSGAQIRAYKKSNKLGTPQSN